MTCKLASGFFWCNNNALKELNDCFGGLLHLGLNVFAFRNLLHLGPNVITFRTLLHLGQLLHLGLQQNQEFFNQNMREGQHFLLEKIPKFPSPPPPPNKKTYLPLLH